MLAFPGSGKPASGALLPFTSQRCGLSYVLCSMPHSTRGKAAVGHSPLRGTGPCDSSFHIILVRRNLTGDWQAHHAVSSSLPEALLSPGYPIFMCTNHRLKDRFWHWLTGMRNTARTIEVGCLWESEGTPVKALQCADCESGL